MGKEVNPLWDNPEFIAEMKRQLDEVFRAQIERERSFQQRYYGIWNQPVTLKWETIKPKRKRKEVKKLP